MSDDVNNNGHLTEAEEIDEVAIMGAKADFEAINDWLEDLKNKIASIPVEDESGGVLTGIMLFSAGYYFGTRSKPRLRWLMSFLSGGVFAYTGLRVALKYLDAHQAKKEIEQERMHEWANQDAMERAKKEQEAQGDHPHTFVEPKPIHEPEEKSKLKNVKIFEPNS